MNRQKTHSASFRDPAGFVFTRDGTLYRQINVAGRADYDAAVATGLYDELIRRGLMIQHHKVDGLEGFNPDPNRYKIIQPEPVPFISYPYEWTFAQLRDAALLTLEIQRTALAHGMILKDASAYNLQFIGTKPIFIDTLSFAKYQTGNTWEGYKQFCEHFIAPLALATYSSPKILRSLRVYLDGIPLALTCSLLPKKARWSRGLLAHLYMHNASQRRHQAGGQTTSTKLDLRKAPPSPDQIWSTANCFSSLDVSTDTSLSDKTIGTNPDVPWKQGILRKSSKAKQRKMSRLALDGLLSSLERTVKKLKAPRAQTEWGDYYEFTNYTQAAFDDKKKLIAQLLKQIKPFPNVVWDVGANNGEFSELAARQGAYTVAFDIDETAVTRNYQTQRDKKLQPLLLPLVQDLTNPSPDLGWAHAERMSLVRRGPADVVLALALIHHLAIGNNLPLAQIAAFLHQIGRHVIIEFVPKADSKVQLLLASRKDIFDIYDAEHFEAAMSKHFDLVAKKPVKGSQRSVYLYKTKP